ncbi:hypothetical protein R3P38DRAFT_3481287 [Favolaschia claudopus]|uniref:Uncharacterized protein n=1 Tax=Favolaschia claudopus TaxID=2862362 RepID=A0AAW0CE14_9AGAR
MHSLRLYVHGMSALMVEETKIVSQLLRSFNEMIAATLPSFQQPQQDRPPSMATQTVDPVAKSDVIGDVQTPRPTRTGDLPPIAPAPAVPLPLPSFPNSSFVQSSESSSNARAGMTSGVESGARESIRLIDEGDQGQYLAGNFVTTIRKIELGSWGGIDEMMERDELRRKRQFFEGDASRRRVYSDITRLPSLPDLKYENGTIYLYRLNTVEYKQIKYISGASVPSQTPIPSTSPSRQSTVQHLYEKEAQLRLALPVLSPCTHVLVDTTHRWGSVRDDHPKGGSHICQGTGRASDADNEGMRGYDGGGGSAGSWDGGGGRYWDGGYASAGSSVKLELGGLSGGRQVLAPFGGPRLRVESFEVPASIALGRDEIGKRKQREAYGIEAKIPVVGLIPSRADQHRRYAVVADDSSVGDAWTVDEFVRVEAIGGL